MDQVAGKWNYGSLALCYSQLCFFDVQLFEQFCQVYVLGLTVSCYQVIYVARPEEVLLVEARIV